MVRMFRVSAAFPLAETFKMFQNRVSAAFPLAETSKVFPSGFRKRIRTETWRFSIPGTPRYAQFKLIYSPIRSPERF